MNTLDIIILVMVLIPAFLGIKNGFLRSIFSLAGIITGLFLATRYNDKVSAFLGFLKLDPKLLSLVSFVLVIIFSYFIFVFIAGKVSRINVITKTFDKILGAVFGIFKGLITASLFLIFTTTTFNLFSKDTVSKSVFYPSVQNIAPDVYNYIQKFFPDAKNFYEELNHLMVTIKI